MKESVVVIRIKNVGQLLAPDLSFDPQQTLSAAAEEYIVEQARDKPKRDALVLKVVPIAAINITANELTEAVREHFAYRRRITEKHFRHARRRGWVMMGVAVLFLAFLVVLVRLGTRYLPETGLTRVLTETLIILGWVALWRPAESLLYDGIPFIRDIRLYKRLEQSQVVIDAPAS